MDDAVDTGSLSVAFKEWAVVCRAIAAGRQTVLLRKGGIDEGRDGFRVAHRRFALYPTFVHQQSNGIVDDARPLLDTALATRPHVGRVRIELVAAVEEAFHVREEAKALSLAGQHILSEATVRQRFHYRDPGLFVLLVRAALLPSAVEIVETVAMAGCRSWAPLDEPIQAADAAPVLSAAAWLERAAATRRLLAEDT